MSEVETHYYGDGHDHGAPDAYDPRADCGARQLAATTTGSHTHLCRLTPGHNSPHRCHSGDGHTW